jgi:hypothetical protein
MTFTMLLPLLVSRVTGNGDLIKRCKIHAMRGDYKRTGPGSGLGGLIIQRLALVCRRVKLGQDRVAIFIAFAMEELLMGAERSHPSLDFFAEAADMNGQRTVDLDGLGRPLHFRDLVNGSCLNRHISQNVVSQGVVALNVVLQNIAATSRRLISGDRLNKRLGLRDQKVALLDPFHCSPRSAGISAKSGQSIKL